MKYLLIFIISLYKKIISPFTEVIFGKACRFNPTCSEYTLEMIKKYGAGKGVSLGFAQLSKCHSY